MGTSEEEKGCEEPPKWDALHCRSHFHVWEGRGQSFRFGGAQCPLSCPKDDAGCSAGCPVPTLEPHRQRKASTSIAASLRSHGIVTWGRRCSHHLHPRIVGAL